MFNLVSLFSEIASEFFTGSLVHARGVSIPVGRTGGGLRKVEMIIDGQPIHAIEQNPNKGSEHAAQARAGHKVIQFTAGYGKYLGKSVDGKVELYPDTPQVLGNKEVVHDRP